MLMAARGSLLTLRQVLRLSRRSGSLVADSPFGSECNFPVLI